MKHFISIAVSTKKFEDKPSKTDWPSMVYTNRTVDFMSFLKLIKQGYVFTNIHSLNGTFTANEKKTTNFVSAQYIGIDIESNTTTIPTFNEAWTKIICKPSIGYETVSNGLEGKGNRYRFIYFFNEKITDIKQYEETYYRIISMLKKSYDFNTIDNCGKEVSRAFYGNAKDCNVKFEDIIYSVNDFNNYEPYQEEKSFIKKKVSIYYKSSNITKYKSSNSEPLLQKVLKDFYEMPLDEFAFMHQNDYLWMQSNRDSFAYNADGYAVTNGNLIELNRRFKKDIKGRIVPRLLRDGEQRRKNLLGLGMVQKALHKGNLDLGGILYCLVMEMLHFIDNTKDEITKEELYNIASYIDSKDPDTISYSTKKIIANPNLSTQEKKKIVAIGRGIENRKNIFNQIDTTLTFNENLQKIGCDRKTLKRVYQENNLIASKKQAAKALYTYNMTANELIMTLSDNDIIISRKTAYNYITEFEEEYRLAKSTTKVQRTSRRKIINIRVIDLSHTLNHTLYITHKQALKQIAEVLNSITPRRGKHIPMHSFYRNDNESIIAFSPPQSF